MSQLGLGTLPFGGATPESEALTMIERCLDAGVNHFDCADIYSSGRLDTDRIDLLYLHGFDQRTDLDHSLRALDRLVNAGKVLYLGVSN